MRWRLIQNRPVTGHGAQDRHSFQTSSARQATRAVEEPRDAFSAGDGVWKRPQLRAHLSSQTQQGRGSIHSAARSQPPMALESSSQPRTGAPPGH